MSSTGDSTHTSIAATTTAVSNTSNFVDALNTLLADCLPHFSLSLVRVVLAYLVCGSAKRGAYALKYMFNFELNRSGEKQEAVKPGRVAAINSGCVAVISSGQAQIFDEWAHFIRAFPITKTNYDVAFDARTCELFVTDYELNGVRVYNADSGALVRTFTTRDHPRHITNDGKGQVFITQYGVLVYTVDGSFVRNFCNQVSEDDSASSDASGIAVCGEEVFVADNNISVIQVFDLQGKFKRWFGSEPNPLDSTSGPRKREFLHGVLGMCVDNGDNLLCCCRDSRSIEAWTTDGDFLVSFGQKRLRRPSSVCVSQSGLIFVTDLELSHVCVFGFEY